ncbi:hypothetical protein [uncultured Gammaproteobacteria bacterium]|nr:hypothetical protein [uncultured Gammaproteobacteria bacterium]CAC9525749.1 hypothetical protein [uncultured Gammaproteobacteria bacterium]
MKHAKIYTIDLRTKIPYETVEFKEFFLKKFFNPNPKIEPPNPKNTNQNPKKPSHSSLASIKIQTIPPI